MQTVTNTIGEWLEWHLEGFIAFPIVWYIVKNFGAVLWADVQSFWAKYVSKTPVTPVVTPVAPVING